MYSWKIFKEKGLAGVKLAFLMVWLFANLENNVSNEKLKDCLTRTFWLKGRVNIEVEKLNESFEKSKYKSKSPKLCSKIGFLYQLLCKTCFDNLDGKKDVLKGPHKCFLLFRRFLPRHILQPSPAPFPHPRPLLMACTYFDPQSHIALFNFNQSRPQCVTAQSQRQCTSNSTIALTPPSPASPSYKSSPAQKGERTDTSQKVSFCILAGIYQNFLKHWKLAIKALFDTEYFHGTFLKPTATSW